MKTEQAWKMPSKQVSNQSPPCAANVPGTGPKSLSLAGKVAVISGGATGIGLGISQGLAEAGASVVLCSRREAICVEVAESIVKSTGAIAEGLRCDITARNETQQMVEQVLKMQELGRIDILVNCAGIGASEKTFLKMNESDWDRIMNINLKGVFNLSQAVVPIMVEQGEGGKVINVSSIMGHIAAPYMADYCSSKAALTHLTKVLALEWADYNIQVNAILPGYFETSMNARFLSTKAGQRLIREKIPLQRPAQIEEIKGLAVYLASEASNFMTGSAVILDGGQTLS
jgi:NAD(P)-dependent dehydrogenase (short-subunit alcohol dehydrogenase family)